MRHLVTGINLAVMIILVIAAGLALASIKSAYGRAASEPEDLYALVFVLVTATLGLAAAALNTARLIGIGFSCANSRILFHGINILFLLLVLALWSLMVLMTPGEYAAMELYAPALLFGAVVASYACACRR